MCLASLLCRVTGPFGPLAWSSKKRSKKLAAVPDGAKGGTSSRPGTRLTVSSMTPKERVGLVPASQLHHLRAHLVEPIAVAVLRLPVGTDRDVRLGRAGEMKARELSGRMAIELASQGLLDCAGKWATLAVVDGL
jgi:hypothetical protein